MLCYSELLGMTLQIEFLYTNNGYKVSFTAIDPD